MESKRRAGIVINPSKFEETEESQQRVNQAFTEAGWETPLWLESTVEDPGTGMARQALEQGVAVVCAMGGDGTVRHVASALAGTGVPLGLIPSGTGNLLARNLGIAVDDMDEALDVILHGRDLAIDVARMEINRPQAGATAISPTQLADNESVDSLLPPPSTEEAFLIMGGIGLDAEVMGSVSGELKSKVGWVAYVVAGADKLLRRRFRATVSYDGGTPEAIRARSLVVGNVGSLTAGLELIPAADYTDGCVDTIVIKPASLMGWARLAMQVARQTADKEQRLAVRNSKTVEVTTERPTELQVDGDHIGLCTGFRVRMDQAALVVRMPAEGSET